jgi:hypothetical protein
LCLSAEANPRTSSHSEEAVMQVMRTIAQDCSVTSGVNSQQCWTPVITCHPTLWNCVIHKTHQTSSTSHWSSSRIINTHQNSSKFVMMLTQHHIRSTHVTTIPRFIKFHQNSSKLIIFHHHACTTSHLIKTCHYNFTIHQNSSIDTHTYTTCWMQNSWLTVKRIQISNLHVRSAA